MDRLNVIDIQCHHYTSRILHHIDQAKICIFRGKRDLSSHLRVLDNPFTRFRKTNAERYESYEEQHLLCILNSHDRIYCFKGALDVGASIRVGIVCASTGRFNIFGWTAQGHRMGMETILHPNRLNS
jgi:hypothetical protein